MARDELEKISQDQITKDFVDHIKGLDLILTKPGIH